MKLINREIGPEQTTTTTFLASIGVDRLATFFQFNKRIGKMDVSTITEHNNHHSTDLGLCYIILNRSI